MNLLVRTENHAGTFACMSTALAWYASIGSAERVAAGAREGLRFHVVSSLYRRRVGRAGGFKPRTRRLEAIEHCLRQLGQSVCPKAANQEPGSVARHTPRVYRNARPNPSFKPSPNGKPPGPVCGKVHSPQPGPGVSPLVPA